MPQVTPANELRFSMRTLVIGVVVITVAMGLYTWFGQSLSLQARWLGYTWGMILFFILVPYYFYLSWARARVNRKSGGRLMPAGTIVIEYLEINFLPVFIIVGCGLAGLFVIKYATDYQHAHGLAVPSQQLLKEAGFMYGMLFLLFRALWHSGGSNELKRQWLCENGLLTGGTRVIPWAGFRKWDWKPGFPNTARLWGTSGRFYLFPVDPSLRDEAADVLNHYITLGPREGGTHAGRKKGAYMPPVLKPRQ